VEVVWDTWTVTLEPVWDVAPPGQIEFRLPPDKFAAEKAAHAAGKMIEYRRYPNEWQEAARPTWNPELQYRVKPLEFGDPPAGWTWHNPGNLTPEQVEVDKRWRLCLVGETIPEDYEYYREISETWHPGCNPHRSAGVGTESCPWVRNTYRTKAPLPAAKTPEEIEHAAFQAWYDAAPLEQRVHAAKHGWKATVAAHP